MDTSTLLTLLCLLVSQCKGSPTYVYSQPDCAPGVEYGYDYYQGPSYQETLQAMVAETLAAIRDIIRITSRAVREELAYVAQKWYEKWECEPEVSHSTNNDPDLGDFTFDGYPAQPMVHPIPFSEGDSTNQSDFLIDVRFGDSSDIPNFFGEGYAGTSLSSNISLELDNYQITNSSQDTSTDSEVNTEIVFDLPKASNKTDQSLTPVVFNSSAANISSSNTMSVDNRTQNLESENEVTNVVNDNFNNATLRENTTKSTRDPKI